MMSKIIIVLFHILLSFELKYSNAQTWIKAGYWYFKSDLPISDIKSALFTHLHFAFAGLNSFSYELSISSDDEKYFTSFTNTVKQKNPSITTLLSIGGGSADYTVLSLMASNASHRKSFIDSSIKMARLYGFQGLDFCWVSANTSSDMINMGLLFQEWRAAVNSESAKSSGLTELILTAAVEISPNLESASFPVDSIRDNLNWVNVMAYNLYMPEWYNFTAAQGALYDPSGHVSADDGIGEWIGSGLSASKLVLSLPFYGYAWNLENANDNGIGAPATGPANIGEDGFITFKNIKSYIQRYGATVRYNKTYVVKYFSVGPIWVSFDDAEVVKRKVAYGKQKKLLGYSVWEVSYDDNWELSLAAQGEDKNQKSQVSRKVLVLILTPTATIVLLLGLVICYLKRRKLKLKGKFLTSKESKSKINHIAAAPNLQVFTLAEIEAATGELSIENKLGEGGYGPVYKGELPNGQEIAVKLLSKTSTQGFEEFKNEVVLTAKLQHVNLVRLLGFCTERNEQMLIYEYMPNKSLDFYLFDPSKSFILDWRRRIGIIEGITQGLLYLQEYSRMTIIHRDIKASNILLDEEMKPKISDFGMARTFLKHEHEANTGRIVGTYGYVPPEYVKKGVYSTKSDVYSFGVLLLQIISGKRNAYYYGLDENLNLLDYAYELWNEDKGMELMDPVLDDTISSLKLIRCMQTALLCVQETAKDRPSMLEVSSMLKNESAALTIPKKTAFSRKTDEDQEEDHKPILQQEICSDNFASLRTGSQMNTKVL